MYILRKLAIIALVTTALLSGCRSLPSVNQPLPPIENGPNHTDELAPPDKDNALAPATTDQATTLASPPVPSNADKSSVTTPSERLSKPRLSYTVSEGELLWAIAKRPDVYGDPLLWPLIYQANRDQIKDPRIIHAGQTLTIPRNVSDNEREEARNRAKKSDIFPLEELLRTPH